MFMPSIVTAAVHESFFRESTLIKVSVHLPYTRHHDPHLIRNRSWILAIHKDRVFPKKPLEKKEMDFKNGVNNIQTAGHISVCTLFWFHWLFWWINLRYLFQCATRFCWWSAHFCKMVDFLSRRGWYATIIYMPPFFFAPTNCRLFRFAFTG